MDILQSQRGSFEDACSSSDLPVKDGQLAVPASMLEATPRALKSGDAFALFDPHGDVLGTRNGPQGVYYCDTRHLSYWRMTICGSYPMLLGSTVDDRIDALIVDLTNPDLRNRDGEEIPNDVLHFSRTKFLAENSVYERIMIRNFDDCAHRFTVEISIGTDFLDMFEVRGEKRQARGKIQPAFCDDARIVHSYRGLDDIERATSIAFQPRPCTLSLHRAEYELELAPGERSALYFCTRFDDKTDTAPARGFLSAYRELRQKHRTQEVGRPRLISSNTAFDSMIARSISDIATLTTDTPQGSCVYAGIPWYCTLFGRDSLITALQLLWYDPSIAKGTLLRLASLQAHEDNSAADAEPGKILHETRLGEMANLGEIPFKLYYGSVDSTPLFVYLAGEYFRRSGDRATIERLWPHIEAALSWIDVSGDRDGDGFFEYGRRMGTGLRNQGWKDSHDAISHADGRLAEGPIAVVEMQAYVYGAWQSASDLCEARGYAQEAAEWRRRASDLRSRFDQTFFDEEMGSYVLALDGQKEPCRVVSSNAGHALLTGIALEERAASVARRLMEPDCFSGWGIRTLSSGERRYNPMSYHNGSIWPHDNSLIAAGLSRYGMQREAGRVFSALFEASTYFDQNRLPELFCGFKRRSGRGPTLYPVACTPQAWSSAAPLYMVQSALGLSVRHCNEIAFSCPQLPPFLSKLALDGVRCNAGAADLDIQQFGHATSVFVRNRTGDISVSVIS